MSVEVSRALMEISGAGEARIGPLISLPQVLIRYGVKPEKVFIESGINPQLFKNSENRLPRESLGRLLAECAKMTQRRDFGLLIGEDFSLTNLGIIGRLMRNSTTVGEALRMLVLHLHLHDRFAVPLMIKSDTSHVFLGYSTHLQALPGAAQLHDLAITVIHQILIELCGRNWTSLHVQFAHHKPKDISHYRRLFGRHIRFNAEISGLSIPAELLDHHIADADLKQHANLMRTIQEIENRGVLSFSEKVQRMQHQLLLSGSTLSSTIAKLFGISERSLRQQLQVEGTNMQKILAKIRFELSQQLLQETQLPISEIAAALCYTDPAVFSRAFRSWTGVSPRQWRSKLIKP